MSGNLIPSLSGLPVNLASSFVEGDTYSILQATIQQPIVDSFGNTTYGPFNPPSGLQGFTASLTFYIAQSEYTLPQGGLPTTTVQMTIVDYTNCLIQYQFAAGQLTQGWLWASISLTNSAGQRITAINIPRLLVRPQLG